MSQLDSSFQPDPNKITPDDSLPAVEPPTAGFILQLFVIPGIIVLLVVMVWLAFGWLSDMGGDPRGYIAQMRQRRANSWQLAANFAELLRQNDQYKKDPLLAKDTAKLLSDLLDQPLPPPGRDNKNRNVRNEEVAFRGFLCKVLGEFHVAEDALPVLIRAASSHDDDDELRIRLAALEAIAVLAENVKPSKRLDNQALMAVLDASSRDPDHKLSQRAAIALASIGTPAAIDRLAEMLDEPHYVDVHYNVATSLARNGSDAGIDILLEMLDPNQDRALAGEPDQEREFKRASILANALRATRKLAERNPEADMTELLPAIATLSQADVPRQIRVEAASTLNDLR